MFDDKIYNQKMDKTIEVFSKELTSLRTGRANANMLDLIKVDVYGQKLPINQLASITTPEARMINVQVWDLNNVPLIDSSINFSPLTSFPFIAKKIYPFLTSLLLVEIPLTIIFFLSSGRLLIKFFSNI